jgi:hypothetical protein
VHNTTNINKTKESVNSADQQFHQYQQNKESVNSDGPSTAYTFFCFVDIGGIVDQHCLHFLLFC